MKKFLICLAPALLLYASFFVATSSSSKLGNQEDFFIVLWSACLAIGALCSGIFAGRGVYRSSGLGKGGKMTVGILTGVAVACGYAVLVFGGCCALAATLL